jgi:hypothetical protein
MRKVLIIAVLAAAATPAAARAQDPRDAVLAVVKNLFDGMRKRDTALMRAQFAPGARLLGINPKSGKPELETIDPSLWIGGVGRGSGAAWDEKIFDPVVELDDNVAHVWTYYEFWRGTELSHCGYDSINLVKLGDGWKVTQVADTRRKDCTPRK